MKNDHKPKSEKENAAEAFIKSIYPENEIDFPSGSDPGAGGSESPLLKNPENEDEIE